MPAQARVFGEHTRAGYALQIPSSDRIRAQHHAARPARGGANRAQDSEIPQELEGQKSRAGFQLRGKSQTESGHKWDRERARRFHVCEAPRAPRFHDFGASSRSKIAPKIPRFHKSSRGKNRAQDSNFVARARQNRASSRGQIPCRWRYRGRFIALRAHGALARAAALAGAAARPAQPYRVGERNTNEIPHKIPHCLARFASRARPAARLRRALCWRVRVAGSPNSKCALKQRYDKNRGVGIGRGKPGKENAIAFVCECFLQQNSSFFLFVVECRNEFEFGSKKS